MSKAGQLRSKAAETADATDLAGRIRAVIPAMGRSERRMFGGVCFMLNGNMVAGTFRDELLVRVGKERNAEALKQPGARPMEMRGRPLDGYVMVKPASLNDGALKDWIRLAMNHTSSLPAKSKPARKGKGRK
ncbi:TfoX/Sxy family protein [Dongia deserti]|uniref:TfoX/Sxy family protein n=1 Tax=Dongia deserti TaxID=2268030 RepID=UPI000E64FBD9|nr:TfoX/Sxy family protein [Dongia deserti]